MVMMMVSRREKRQEEGLLGGWGRICGFQCLNKISYLTQTQTDRALQSLFLSNDTIPTYNSHLTLCSKSYTSLTEIYLSAIYCILVAEGIEGVPSCFSTWYTGIWLSHLLAHSIAP